MRTYPNEPITHEGMLSTVYGLPFYEKVDVQKMIDDAYLSGQKELTLPKGAYRLWPRGDQDVIDTHILLKDMHDFTLNAYDVVFVYQDLTVCGLQLLNCQRVQINGLTVDYESTGHAQCKITGFDPEDRYFTVHVDEGYQYELDNPSITPDEFATAFYDKDTRLLIEDMRGLGYFTRDCVEDLGDRNLKIHTHLTTDQKDRLRIGDFFILGSRPIMRGTTYTIDCSDVTYKDYTVWSGLFAVAERGTKKRTKYLNFRVVPGPKPYGATEERIRSTAGDAAHMRSCYEGALMENCYCENMGDDGVNFYGLFSRVAEQVGENTLIIAERLPLGFAPGERLRIYDREVSKIGEFTVILAAPMPKDYRPASDTLNRNMGCASFEANAYYKVILDRRLRVSAGDWVSNTAHVGNGFILRNNTYRNLPSRGVLIKANDGLIENCTFDHCGATGVQIRPEIDWVESGYSHRITIRNNTFIDCGERGGDNSVIMVSGHKAHDQRDIVIEGNRFISSHSVEVGLGCAQGVTLRDNHFGIDSKTDSLPCVFLRNGRDFWFFDNRFSGNRVPVASGSTPQEIYGIAPASFSVASDAIMSLKQGFDGWTFDYAPIGKDEYTPLNYYSNGGNRPDGWWQDEEGNETYGCILSWWANTYMHPGTDYDVAKTYTCPRDGRVLLDAMSLIVGSPSEDGINIAIFKNTEVLLPWETWYDGVNRRFSPITVDVCAGDQLHFRVNKNGNNEDDGLDWNPSVLYVK